MKIEFRHYAKELLNIALPIIMGNLGFILIGAGDVLIAAKHSTDTLASISIANAIISVILTFGIGLMASISPILSNFRGERKSAKKYFFPTIRFSVIISILTMVLILLAVPLIDFLHFEAKLVPHIKEYMLITAFSTFGIYLQGSLKEFLQAFEIVFVPNLVNVFGVFLNVGLNIIFVFGLGPIPSMGVVGLAIASLISRYLMGLMMLAYCLSIMNVRNHHDKSYYKTIIKIGLPISLAIMVEFVAFNSIAIIMGRVSGLYAAAQNLVCTLTTVSFMVPLAISNAIAVKVGFANGADNIKDLKRYSFVGVVISVGFMLCSSIVFSIFPDELVGIFTKDADLIKICVPVLYVLSIFQVFDGLQISLAGIFKGMKNTNVVLLANLFAYWLISLPLGYTLAFHYNYELPGFWWGLAIAAIILCVILVVILLKKFKNLQTTCLKIELAQKCE